MTSPLVALGLWLLHVATVLAAHSVQTESFCGTGTLVLDQVPSRVLATGPTTYTNETINAVAFLNNGNCGPNGGHCTTVDIELGTQDGGGSSVVIDLLPTHEFTVSVGFSYFNGCDGAGTECLTADCPNAQTVVVGTGVILCQDPNASVLITFCPDKKPASGGTTSKGTTTTTSSSSSSSSESTSSTTSSTTSSISTTSNTNTSTAATTTTSDTTSVPPVGLNTSPPDSSQTTTSSTTSPDAAATSSKSSSTGAIAGGVVGGLAVLGIIAGIFFVCWRRRREPRDSDLLDPPVTASSWRPLTTGGNAHHSTTPLVSPFLTSASEFQPESRTGKGMRLVGDLPTPSSAQFNVPPGVPSQSSTSHSSSEKRRFIATTSPGTSDGSTSRMSSASAQPPSPQSAAQGQQPNMEEIIEGLANRFGWTAPGRDGEAPPIYRHTTTLPPVPSNSG